MSKENWGSKTPQKTTVVSGVLGLLCLFVVITTGLLNNSVQANDTHCSLELNNEKRELCFQSNPEQQYKQRRPGWPILNVRSYATGKPNASATRIAEEHVMCGGIEGTISLGLHCADDGMKVVFSMGCSFGSPNSPTIVELYADNKSSDWKAKVLRNQLGLSIEDSISASRFVKSMQGHEKVVMVFTPNEAPKFVGTFSLEGFDKAVERVEELCPI